VRLAQGGVEGTGICSVHSAAGETDLPCVLAQTVGAPGQEDMQTSAAFDQADQHGSFAQRGFRREKSAQFVLVPARSGGDVGKWMQRALDMGQAQDGMSIDCPRFCSVPVICHHASWNHPPQHDRSGWFYSTAKLTSR